MIRSPRVGLMMKWFGLPRRGQNLRLGRSGLFVNFTSAAIGNDHLDHGTAVTTKPFAVDALAIKVRDLISEA